jgi:cytidine deaminase
VELVPPCGRCRELLREYADEAQVILPNLGDAEDFSVTEIAALLPHPFVRRPRPAGGRSDIRQPPRALESGP